MFAVYLTGTLVLMAFSLWASWSVKRNFTKYSEQRASCGLTGAEAAHEMLERAGVHNVRIVETEGMLSDHYDPSEKVIRLSSAVFHSQSVAALGVACHEAGHAIQDAQRYPFLVVRSMAVPAASFGSTAGVLILMAGLFLQMTGLAIVGLILFAAVAGFQLVNLPVEFDATARAKAALMKTGMVSPGREQEGVNKVLDAAAMTYVAATASAIFTLLYYAWMVFGNQRQEN